MSLADIATEDAPRIPNRVCAVCHVASCLDDDTRATLTRLLDLNVSSAKLARHLTDEGHGHVGPQSVTRHRRSECAGGRGVA